MSSEYSSATSTFFSCWADSSDSATLKRAIKPDHSSNGMCCVKVRPVVGTGTKGGEINTKPNANLERSSYFVQGGTGIGHNSAISRSPHCSFVYRPTTEDRSIHSPLNMHKSSSTCFLRRPSEPNH